MRKLIGWLDRTFYGEYTNSWDNHQFRERALSLISSEDHVLDLGAGRGYLPMMDFRGHCEHFVGVDPDPVVFENPYLDEARQLQAPEYGIPYGDEEFDVVLSNNVIEHVQDADFYFSEVNRVLKPGGVFLAKTPNSRHYVALMARLTPHWFHEVYNHIRGRDHCDTFPTTYICNTRSAVQRYAASQGLREDGVSILEGRPEYLRISVPTYLCGLAYERIVNSTDMFEAVRCVMLIQLRKPKAEESTLPLAA